MLTSPQKIQHKEIYKKKNYTYLVPQSRSPCVQKSHARCCVRRTPRSPLQSSVHRSDLSDSCHPPRNCCLCTKLKHTEKNTWGLRFCNTVLCKWTRVEFYFVDQSVYSCNPHKNCCTDKQQQGSRTRKGILLNGEAVKCWYCVFHVCIYTLYSMDYCLQIIAFNQSINQFSEW